MEAIERAKEQTRCEKAEKRASMSASGMRLRAASASRLGREAYSINMPATMGVELKKRRMAHGESMGRSLAWRSWLGRRECRADRRVARVRTAWAVGEVKRMVLQ